MKKTVKDQNISRRKFISTTTKSGLALTILPSSVIAGLSNNLPGNKLNIAGIGVGGIGLTNLGNVGSENIVALCDVDWDYADSAFKRYPKVPRYTDFRKMLEQQKDIDAVVVATPDHTHAVAALSAIKLNKHVYVQSPLTHSIFESRVLTETARQYNVVTQMGNQGSSGEGAQQICEWIWAGTIGEITEVHAWTNRPLWVQPQTLPKRGKHVPKTLDWDLFIGPASWRDYHPDYTPWKWRAWWDFGSGTLGDMGCHMLDPVFRALHLKHPEAVEATSTPFNLESPPQAQKITWWFPRRDNLPKIAMPPVKIHWYDGGLLPDRPEELKQGVPLGNDPDGGVLFIGTKGKMMCGAYGKNPVLLPMKEMQHFQQPAKILRRIPEAFHGGHEKDWVRACKEPVENRLQPTAHFNYAGLLNETVQLGALAVRLQSLNKRLLWDGPNMAFSNIDPSEQLTLEISNEFNLIKGQPGFDRKTKKINAREMVTAWIRHTYRRGWEQI